MDVKNLVMVVVGMVLAAVMIGGVLLPAVGSVDDSNHITYLNDKMHAKPYSDLKSGDVVRSEDMANLYVNDELITRSNIMGENYVKTSSFLFTGNSLIRMSPDGNSISYIQNITSFTLTMTGDMSATIDGVNSNGPFNVVFENIGWGYVATNTGEWAEPYYYSPGLIYINNVNQIYGCGPVDGNSQFYNFNGSTLRLGTIVQNTPIAFNLTDESNGVYSFSPALNGDVVATTDGGVTFDVRNFIVPISVESDELVKGADGIINIVPIVSVAGLVMAGIYIFISRK